MATLGRHWRCGRPVAGLSLRHGNSEQWCGWYAKVLSQGLRRGLRRRFRSEKFVVFFSALYGIYENAWCRWKVSGRGRNRSSISGHSTRALVSPMSLLPVLLLLRGLEHTLPFSTKTRVLGSRIILRLADSPFLGLLSLGGLHCACRLYCRLCLSQSIRPAGLVKERLEDTHRGERRQR
jgi:hypothetical protein